MMDLSNKYTALINFMQFLDSIGLGNESHDIL